MSHSYDVIIIGAGPGGLSAALYSARARLNTLVVEQKRKTGGQCATTSELENYPGIIQDSGSGLMEKFTQHASRFGAQFIHGRVDSLTLSEDGLHKTVQLRDGTELLAKSVIISTGTRPRILGIPGEEAFAGRGVSYCATCDADFYTDLDVIVVGSGNTAVEEAVFLTRYVSSLTMIVIHEEGHLDADRIAQEIAFANEKITFVWNSIVTAINGDGIVGSVTIKNVKTGKESRLATNGVFMFVGTEPQTDWLSPLRNRLPLTAGGYIQTNSLQETQLPGIFAVGDVCHKFLRQVVTAAGDGATAAVAACQYLEQEEFWQTQVIKNPLKTLVFFWSPLKKQSVQLMTCLEHLVSQAPEWKLVPIDAYKNQRLVARYSISELPVLLHLDKGKEIRRWTQPDESQLSVIFRSKPND